MRVSFDLFSADYSGSQAREFCQSMNWERWELKRGEVHHHVVNIWPNMYQAEILRQVAEGMAELYGHSALRLSTDIGEVFILYQFTLTRKLQELKT